MVPRRTIGAAYGDAFLAAVGTGAAAPRDFAEWNPVETVVRPDPAHTAVYDALYPHYRELYANNRELVHTLAARQLADG